MNDQPPNSDEPGSGATATAGSLLDLAVLATRRADAQADQSWEGFLREPDWVRALARYLLLTRPDAQPKSALELSQWLNRDIATLDDLLNRQVNAILHHPRFQRLEASWRGLLYLVLQSDENEGVWIRVLNISWRDLARDLERALEFDQSQLFRKVYSEQFDTPGAYPMSVLLADFEIHQRPSKDHPYDDLEILRSMVQISAAAFAPLLVGTHPTLLSLDSFRELEQPIHLTRIFEDKEYLKFRSLRDSEDVRFVGLTLPRVLRRLPYRYDTGRADGFAFQEDVQGPDYRKYLWGTAVYMFGAVLVRSFGDCGWFADIRGVPPGKLGGGLVTDLPVHSFGTDRDGIAIKTSEEVTVSDAREKELAELGFIPLCPCKDTELSVFYSNQSLQRPKVYDALPATRNARLSAMLQYMLCVSRFAHYVKVIARDKIGSFATASECEEQLHLWLTRFITDNPDADPEELARYPLRSASVQVTDIPGKPGCYQCITHLQPHFQLDEVMAGVRLVTELAPIDAD